MKTTHVCIALFASSTLVLANNYYNDSSKNIYSNKVRYVQVTKSTPVYEQINQKTPYEECWDEKVLVNNRYSQSNTVANDKLGTLIGGVAGGILGHQVGGGHGKTVATIGGAILGTVIGSNLSQKQKIYNEPYYEIRQKCITKYRYNTQKVLSGYNNIGYFEGEQIVKFSQNQLKTIPVTLSISY